VCGESGVVGAVNAAWISHASQVGSGFAKPCLARLRFTSPTLCLKKPIRHLNAECWAYKTLPNLQITSSAKSSTLPHSNQFLGNPPNKAARFCGLAGVLTFDGDAMEAVALLLVELAPELGS